MTMTGRVVVVVANRPYGLTMSSGASASVNVAGNRQVATASGA